MKDIVHALIKQSKYNAREQILPKNCVLKHSHFDILLSSSIFIIVKIDNILVSPLCIERVK